MYIVSFCRALPKIDSRLIGVCLFLEFFFVFRFTRFGTQ